MKIVERNTKEGRNRLADRQTDISSVIRQKDRPCVPWAGRQTDRQTRTERGRKSDKSGKNIDKFIFYGWGNCRKKRKDKILNENFYKICMIIPTCYVHMYS